MARLSLFAAGQATIYLVRERRHLWQPAPSTWMLAATILDLAAVTALAATGTLMAAVSLAGIGVLLAAVAVATLLLDMARPRCWDGCGPARPRSP